MDNMDISNILLSMGTNILSSIVYDMGKMFIKNGKQSITDDQMSKIIYSFQDDLDEILISQDRIEDRMDFLQKQQETIIKLLLVVFDEKNKIQIKYTENGYQLDGEYSLDYLSEEANVYLCDYCELLPQTIPRALGEAIWPIPTNVKEVLLNELKQNLYNEEY